MISSRHGEILDGWRMEAPRGEISPDLTAHHTGISPPERRQKGHLSHDFPARTGRGKGPGKPLE